MSVVVIAASVIIGTVLGIPEITVISSLAFASIFELIQLHNGITANNSTQITSSDHRLISNSNDHKKTIDLQSFVDHKSEKILRDGFCTMVMEVEKASQQKKENLAQATKNKTEPKQKSYSQRYLYSARINNNRPIGK